MAGPVACLFNYSEYANSYKFLTVFILCLVSCINATFNHPRKLIDVYEHSFLTN
jgi:hypothetical protein